MPWIVYIGCNQGHSTGVVQPTEVAHKLTASECYSLGWIFHATDSHFQNSIVSKGLQRRNRDSWHFMNENDGSPGCIRKGAGTREPRRYDTTIYCVLKVPLLLRDGYDYIVLDLQWCGLILDDVNLQYIRIVESYPSLGLNVFHRFFGRSLPSELQHGIWAKRNDLEAEVQGILVIRGDIQVHRSFDWRNC